MPIYHHLGQLPPKRHTQFRQPDGSLYHEQLFGTVGFDGMSSLLYHLRPPTQVKDVVGKTDLTTQIAEEKTLTARKLIGFDVAPEDDFLTARKPLLINASCQIGVAAPRQSLRDYFYKNADADELLFIHRGSGTLRTLLGNIHFEYGDYLVIPRGIIYQIDFDTEDNRILYTESTDPIYTPKRYRNHFGQLLEHSPFTERDYKLPRDLETHDAEGEYTLKIKKQGMLHELVYATHPFDVVGWDGYNFPYGFSIHNFEPITGRVHQPPPIHQTFETKSFVVCSFCPRLYDYHPRGHPCPLQPLQHRLRRGTLLRRRRFYEPYGYRSGLPHAAPRRHPPRPPPRYLRGQYRQDRHRGAGRHDRHLPPPPGHRRGRQNRHRHLPPKLAARCALTFLRVATSPSRTCPSASFLPPAPHAALVWP